MKNLVRGGIALSIMSLLVAFVYAQTRSIDPASIANDSHTTIESSASGTILINTKNNRYVVHNNSETAAINNKPVVDDKELVKKTGMVKAAGAGRGAFSATAYCLKGRTAMGHGVRRGIIAADPRVLRLGSTVTINAGQWSGSYLVSDTGGRIKGKKLDIWVPSCSEARKFGRRSVNVN
ncbi:MAG: 3D domain-containing protein [Pyrinomonadaceae bacterium]